jgi:hypothetical protein
MLEPPRAHDDKRREHQRQEVFHQIEREANRFGYFPARMRPSLVTTKIEIRNSKTATHPTGYSHESENPSAPAIAGGVPDIECSAAL